MYEFVILDGTRKLAAFVLRRPSSVRSASARSNLTNNKLEEYICHLNHAHSAGARLRASSKAAPKRRAP
jgi:hypothetical protein